jgi:hypothetical protein
MSGMPVIAMIRAPLTCADGVFRQPGTNVAPRGANSSFIIGGWHPHGVDLPIKRGPEASVAVDVAPHFVRDGVC